MGYNIRGTTINLTRGDTFSAKIEIEDSEGNEYIPKNGDRIRFAMKRTYNDELPLLVKEIPTNTMILSLEPIDTKNLDFRSYVYDIELTKSNGDVDTFIARSRINILEEVF